MILKFVSFAIVGYNLLSVQFSKIHLSANFVSANAQRNRTLCLKFRLAKRRLFSQVLTRRNLRQSKLTNLSFHAPSLVRFCILNGKRRTFYK